MKYTHHVVVADATKVDTTFVGVHWPLEIFSKMLRNILLNVVFEEDMLVVARSDRRGKKSTSANWVGTHAFIL